MNSAASRDTIRLLDWLFCNAEKRAGIYLLHKEHCYHLPKICLKVMQIMFFCDILVDCELVVFLTGVVTIRYKCSKS